MPCPLRSFARKLRAGFAVLSWAAGGYVVYEKPDGQLCRFRGKHASVAILEPGLPITRDLRDPGS
jgi:hypothetical protein